MPRTMATITARRIPLLLVILMAATFVSAQSGRRGAPKPTASPAPSPPTATETKANPEKAARIKLLVGIDLSSALDDVPLRVPQVVLDAVMHRLAESKDVAARQAPRRMTRAEAITTAKAESAATESATYVVYLQVVNEQNDYRAESSMRDRLYVNYTIFEPGTAKVKRSGRAQYSAASLGNVSISGRTPQERMNADYAMEETGKQAADGILAAFQIRLGGWPR